MESSQDRDLAPENGSPDQEITSYDWGIGRSYECVFYKRGFTTAQALGGHMNIHRKDRGKPKLNPSSSVNNKPHLDFHASNKSSLFSSQMSLNLSSSQVDFHQFFPPNSSASSSKPRFRVDATQHGFLSSCCKENFCGATLGLHMGVTNSLQRGCNSSHQGAEELDLELRLAHLNP